MSLAITISENATAAVRELEQLVHPERIMKVLVKSAANVLKAHFRERNREGNTQGWPRSNYWNEAAAATSFAVSMYNASVLVDKEGVGLHYFGGTVVPVEAQYLTIPARPEAKGKRAGEFTGLEFIPNKNGGARLVDEAGDVWFWLVKSVTLDPDPSVLPEEEDFNQGIGEGLQDYLAALLDQRGAA